MSRSDITRLLEMIEAGDRAATDELLPLVYDELRKLADRRLAREGPDQTLQATELVHEAYLRLLGPDDGTEPAWDGRGHFFGAAAEAMRRILVDRARTGRAVKRGGDLRRLSLDSAALMLDDVPEELLQLDESLRKLAVVAPEKAALVKLRFFSGLTMQQGARVLGISQTTADRHWAYARAWLYHEIAQSST